MDVKEENKELAETLLNFKNDDVSIMFAYFNHDNKKIRCLNNIIYRNKNDLFIESVYIRGHQISAIHYKDRPDCIYCSIYNYHDDTIIHSFKDPKHSVYSINVDMNDNTSVVSVIFNFNRSRYTLKNISDLLDRDVSNLKFEDFCQNNKVFSDDEIVILKMFMI